MPTFIKTGYWEKIQKGYNGWLNLDNLIASSVGTGSSGQITYWGSSGLTGSNNLLWDNVNKSLTVSGNTYSVGTYWKTIPGTNFPNGPFRGMAYGNGLFVAIANRSAGGTSNTTSVATSPDGLNWTFRTLPALAGLTNIIYQNGIFVAVGQVGTQRGFYSYDGINWFNTTGIGGQAYGITYGKDKFVVSKIDNSLNRIDISYDGKNWQGVATPAAMDLPLTSIVYGNDRFVAIASTAATNSIWTSADGITWTAATRPSGPTTYNGAYGNGLFVIACDQGKMMTSPDAVTWTIRDTPLTGLIWKCIYAEGVFIAAGAFASGQNKFIYSVDGITWKEANTPALNDWGAFAYGNGMVLCVSYNGPDTSALVVKSGDLNSFIPQNDNITHGKQSFTDDVALIQNSRLGIGTSSPSYKLHAVSATALDSVFNCTLATGNTTIYLDNDANNGLRMNTWGSTATGTLLDGTVNRASACAIRTNTNANTIVFGGLSTSASLVYFGNTGFTMSLNNSTNSVSIGTGAFAGYKLDVAGTIRGTQYNLSALNTAPASATATGTLGEIRIDANHIYVCTATNTWKRVAIATW